MSKVTIPCPDGTVRERRTEAPYTHAVIAKHPSVGWYVVSCHTRLDLAKKKRSAFDSKFYLRESTVVEVTR